jgi:hypothetical protein
MHTEEAQVPAHVAHARTGSSELARTIEHVVGAIEAAAASREPFDHLRIASVFPAPLYAIMLEALPERSDYRRMSGRARMDRGMDLIEARTKIDLFPECVRRLPPAKRPVWELVGATLRSPEVRDAWMRRLAPGLERRFGERHGRVGMYPVPILTRDIAGYKIGIHPDTRWKGMTIQLYLPRDLSIEHVGTVFHERDADGSYRRVTRMPFAPNTGYAFAVGKDTYHSVDTVGPEVRTRDSILLTYFVDDTFLQAVNNRWKRFGNFVLSEARDLGRGGAPGAR